MIICLSLWCFGDEVEDLCGSKILLLFGSAAEFRARFRASKCGLNSHSSRFYRPAADLVWPCVGGLICGFCFVIVCSSLLLVSVRGETCASWLWHFLVVIYFCFRLLLFYVYFIYCIIKQQLCNQEVFPLNVLRRWFRCLLMLYVFYWNNFLFIYCISKHQLCNQIILLLNVLRRWFWCLLLFYVFFVYCKIRQQLCNQRVFLLNVLRRRFCCLFKQQICNQRVLLLNVIRRWFFCLLLFYVFVYIVN